MESSVSNVLLRLLHESMDLALYDLYGKTLSLVRQKEKLRVAVIGIDHNFFNCAEAVEDFGLKLKRFFGGDPHDIFHPSKVIKDLESSDYDLLIVGANSHAEELSYLHQLGEHFTSENSLTCPILLIHRLRAGVKNALAKTTKLETCLNFRKLALIAHSLLATYDGCILECGVFKGGTTVFMGMLLREWSDSRRIYACDPFDGMPQPTDPDGDTVFQAGLFTETSFDGVKQYVQEHDLAPQVTVMKGLAQNVLPEVLSREQHVSFALVDTDQYLGTIESLKLIIPKLQENGIVIIDDFNVEGVQQAIAEIKEQYPMLCGGEVSMNFYVLWNRTNSYFLSSCQPG